MDNYKNIQTYMSYKETHIYIYYIIIKPYVLTQKDLDIHTYNGMH